MRALLVVSLLAACGGGSKAPPVESPEPAVAADAPLAWMVGTYARDVGTLHVHASEGATYAVWLGAEQARVWIFDEEGEALKAWSYHGIGVAPAEVVFDVMSDGERVAAFGDGTSLLTLRRAADGAVVLSEAGSPAPFITGQVSPIAAAPAKVLEDASPTAPPAGSSIPAASNPARSRAAA